MAKAVSRVVSGSVELPALFAPDRDAARRLVEFFTANIRNPNTRRAYARAAVQYATWCEAKYVDPYIPEDLRKLPGNWRSRIPGYYGCVQAIDDCVGTLVAALRKPDILTTVSSFSSRITAALSARGSASINARRTTLRSVYRS